MFFCLVWVWSMVGYEVRMVEFCEVLFFEFRFGRWFARWFCFIVFTNFGSQQMSDSNRQPKGNDMTMEHWQIGWVG